MSADQSDQQHDDNYETHFSDEELQAALAGFEKEFQDREDAEAKSAGQSPSDSQSHQLSDTGRGDDTGKASLRNSSLDDPSLNKASFDDADFDIDTILSASSADISTDDNPSAGNAAVGDTASGNTTLDAADDTTSRDAVLGLDGTSHTPANTAQSDAADPTMTFDDELEGLLGNKAKVAMLITRLTSPQLLAAFCQLSDISADCVGSREGAVAILRNVDGDGPESAAHDLTVVVSGMSVVLAVNRADKLEATMYLQGNPGQHFVPPVLFNATAPFVEDVMLGISSVDALRESGLTIVSSADLDHDRSMAIIAQHTRFGRGASHIE